MQKIENMAAKDTGEGGLAAQNAIKLLRTFAFLDHVNIPEELFKSAAENYMNRNVHEEANAGLPLSVTLLCHKTLFLNEEGEWEKIEFISGIQVLLSFSLIKSHNQLYSMHLLVHAWSRSRLPKAEITDLYHRARALLSYSVVPDYDIDNYEYCNLLAPHVRSSSLHAAELKLESRYYDDEHTTFSYVFHYVGDWNERERLLVEQVNERKTELGSKHSNTLTSMENLALTYLSQGRWNEAEKLQVEVLNATKAKLVPNHPVTLSGMNDLSLTYCHQGRWNEAEKLLVEVMNARKAFPSPNYKDTLISMNNLAWAYQSNGRWNEAEKLQVEQFGIDISPSGEMDEAEKLHMEVLNATKAKLGSNHPFTLSSMNNLALTYWSQGME
ncbi:hypothetical protein AX14_009334 [Amanita brunnescens Koide BX004]|nr:hypothetical protein AX14_009334 [Amanita brunnescens Koide BX004]